MLGFLKFIFIFLAACLLYSCEKEGSEEANQLPDTFFSLKEINLSGDKRLNSIVRLNWFGTDPDGYIKGYELSFDQLEWEFTEAQDSTFRFSLSINTDTADINIFVRAIDNENGADPSPASIVVPIKNTPPEVSFDEKLSIPDTSFLVATTAWNASDLDGEETIQQVLISLDKKNWEEINFSQKTFSIAPADPFLTDTTESLIYFGTSSQPAVQRLKGLALNDTNKIYIKVIDQAGAESEIDSTSTFFMKPQRNSTLVVGGLSAADQVYRQSLQAININYDFLNLTANNGQNLPKVWNITFRLQLSFYDKLFLYSDESLFTNTFTGVKKMILEFAASSLQEYANSGGKYFISTSFNHSTPIEGFAGVLPIASLSTENFGSARFFQDSVAFSNLAEFPDLNPSNFVLLGPTVFEIDSADTEVLYQANLSKSRPDVAWEDTKIVASGRRVNGKLNQVFFSLQLWELNGNPSALQDLFDQILNKEFN